MTDIKLIEKVVWLHYREDKNHSEISKKLGISRFKVARILDEAKEKNIIKVEVYLSDESTIKMQRILEERFSLSEVIIINTFENDNQLKMKLGEACAEYFLRVVSSNMKIGVGFSTTINSMIDYLPEIRSENCQIIQIIGGFNSDNYRSGSIDATPMSLAKKINAHLFNISAPIIVNYPDVKKAILEEPIVKTEFEKFKNLDIVFVGLGGINKDCTLCQMGVVDININDQLISRGAVGDINARFFDINGNPVLSDIDDRIIGMDLQTLSDTNRVVGVSGGVDKHNAILGALNGSYIDVLITDSVTARYLIDHKNRSNKNV